MESIPLQAMIGGLSARSLAGAEAVFGELDVASGVLLIDATKTLKPGVPEVRIGECALVTNNPGTDDRDALFTDADLRQAIDDYFAFAGRGLLVLEDVVARHNPATKIEPDGLDERGRKYRIAPDMSDGQLAVIVMCWFALQQSGFTRQLEAFDDLQDMRVTTVGIPGMEQGVMRYEMGGKLAIGFDGWPV